MSDEEKQDGINVDTDDGESGGSTPQKKGGFLSPFIIKLLTIAASIIGIVFLVIFLIMLLVPQMVKSGFGGAGAPDTEGIKRASVEHFEYLRFDDAFTQQLLDGKMLKLKIALGYKGRDKRLQTELTQIVPEMRDIIIKQLSQLKSDYFEDPDALSKLEEDLLKQINRNVNTGKVDRILFQEFTLM
jgi:flagellar basal body-associated protein FliL